MYGRGCTRYRPVVALLSTTSAPDGWIAVLSEGAAPEYYVRCREDGQGGAEIVELLIAAPSRISAAALRDVPIGRIEAAINATPRLRDAALKADGSPDPLLERLRAGTGGPRDIHVTVTDRATATDSFSVGGSGVGASFDPPLQRPDRSDPAAFYARVAARYQALVAHTAKPGVAIAQEAGVPVGTARRWINEARRRGLLPPGRQGRAK